MAKKSLESFLTSHRETQGQRRRESYSKNGNKTSGDKKLDSKGLPVFGTGNSFFS